MANTSAPLSEVAIATMAAGLLDDYHITSLDDDSPLGRYMAREFGYVRDELLEEYPWSFAADRAVLPEISTKPAFDWRYQYQLPEGTMRVRPPSLNGVFNEPPIPFVVERGKLLCNVGPTLKVMFTFREINVAKWSALAGRTLACKLAMYASQRITGKANYFEKCRTAYIDAGNLAKHHDSMFRGTPEVVYDGASVPGQDVLTVRGTC